MVFAAVIRKTGGKAEFFCFLNYCIPTLELNIGGTGLVV